MIATLSVNHCFKLINKAIKLFVQIKVTKNICSKSNLINTLYHM